MQSFLEKLVQHLCARYGNDIGELCIVLPNRRAGLFLKTHLSKQLDQTFWAPEIYATEDFVALLAELEIADSTTLLFELYETIKSKSKNEIDSFDEFSKWGQTLLSDLNEIDRYLVDGEQLFGNLKDIKELEAWSLNSEEGLTDFQKQYLNFWQSLGDYYFDFSKRLLDKHQAYQGLAYKIVAGNVEERVNKHPWKKIIFAGFNALNKAEERIIEKLLNSGKAEIIWDTDAYYINDVWQEAGTFFRKYQESLKYGKDKNLVIDENLLSTEKKKITIIGAAKNVAQAKIAGNLVADLQKQNESLQTTALVLADENLLFPVLHSLPENLQDINVTMGYPLKNTPLAGYFDLLFNLHINAIKLNQGKANYSFYHKDLLNLLSHPYTSLLIQTEKGTSHHSIKPIVNAIQNRNIVFAALSTIENIIVEKQSELLDILKPILNYWTEPANAIGCVNYIIDTLKNSIIAQQDSDTSNKANLELEYLFAFTKINKRIQALQLDYPSSIGDLKTLQTVFKQIVRSTTLPFYGEPLMGLQVMGMLETRTLDFENVILLSCNEDILPSGKTVNSFIPFELKRYFGLPTYSDKDAIFAYHFYRLLQRAKNIYLLYNTENDALGSGEKSRFLTQLIHELPKVNKQVVIEEKLLNIPVTMGDSENVIRIQKTKIILEKLKSKAATGFSPSLLNTYRNCSLQFYFQAIAGLKEADEVEETIGADTLGNSIHEVLEKLYQPFVGKKLSAADIKGMKQEVEALTITIFEKEYSKTEISYGKNFLTVKVALKFLSNFLNSEIKNIHTSEKEGKPIIIKALEQQLETTIKIGDQIVKLHGKADRIDSVGAINRFVDYKTGKAEDKELKLTKWEELKNDPLLAKSFQLMMYAWMYQKMNPIISDNMVSGIITFRELSMGLKTVKINGDDKLDVSVLNKFEEQLKNILSEIFDPETEFSQTPDRDNCKYCTFKGICNR